MYPIKLNLPEGKGYINLARRVLIIEEAILTYLEEVGEATIPQIAAALTLTPSVIRPRMPNLRDAGKAHSTRRERAGGKMSQHSTWALGEGSDLVTSKFEAKVTLVKAVQVGMKRDPLIEAFFGPAGSESAAPALLSAA